MRGRFTAFFTLLVVVALVFTGCSSSENSEQSNNNSEDKDEQVEVVKLTMGSWRTEDAAAYEKIFAEFNKLYPNIEIEFNPTKSTEYNTVLNTQLQTGGGPDIIHMRPYSPGIMLGQAGFLEPITGMEGLEQFSEDVMKAATDTDGTVYGVPMAVNSAQVFYNTKIFDEYQLEEPKTWDELIALAEELKENGITPFAFGSKDGWIGSITHSVLGPAFYGGNDFVQDVLSGESNFQSEAFVQSIQALKDLEPYFPENFVGVSFEDMRTMFLTEEAAMYILGDWSIGEFESMNPDLEYDVFPVPSATGGEPTVTTWVDGSFGINAKSEYKEEAKKFLEFATTQQFGTMLSNELKRISPIPGVESDYDLVTKIAQYANQNATPYLMLVHFNEGNPTSKQDLEMALQGLFLDALTAEEVAQKVQESVDQWFQPTP